MDGNIHIYQPLDPIKQEIRLLELLPAPNNGQIQASCQLSSVSLLEKRPFTALSYVWGDALATETILLNGIKWQVTKNLAAALKYFTQIRSRFQDGFRLWVDAVCINQVDTLERNQQVSLMKDLYSSADYVFSWLGADPCITKAFKTLRIVYLEVQNANGNVETLGNLDWLQRYPELYAQNMQLDEQTLIPNKHWTSLRDFVDLTYWSRMWIFQEVVLSKPNRLSFFTTGDQMSGDELKKALVYVRSVAHYFAERPRPEFVPEEAWKYLKRLQFSDTAKQVESLLLAKEYFFQDMAEKSDRAGLCILSAFNHRRRASDPRDYYYSLIGPSQLALNPQYGHDNLVQTVCIDFVRAYLEVTLDSPWALFFLHDAVGPKGKTHYGLPSWAPGYHLPMEGHVRGSDLNVRADDDVFNKLSKTKRPRPLLVSEAISVLGVRITVVNFVSYRPSRNFQRTGAMSAYLLDFARRYGPVYVTGIPAATALFATLMRCVDGKYNFLRGLFVLENLGQILDSNAIDDKQVWCLIERAYKRCAPESLSAADLEFLMNPALKLAEEWLRALTDFELLEIGRLFDTEEGYLGLAPLEVTAGDVVCVLDSFQYPVVLRPTDDYYVFIGACFVLGLMTGEAKAFLEDGRASPEVFDLK
jgi:hypothetical protein